MVSTGKVGRCYNLTQYYSVGTVEGLSAILNQFLRISES